MRKILPSILAFITGRERYLPRDIEWVKGNWTHNIFRAWEVVFWRAFGPNGVGDTIRAESAVEGWMDKEGNLHVHRTFYTVEALVAHAEGMVRKAWKEAWEPKVQYGYMPQPVFLTLMILGVKLSLHGDMNGMLAPLIGGAIAYDASSKGIASPGSSLTFSLTTSGSNRLLILAGGLQDSSRSWSDMTYAGSSATQIGSNFIYTANSAPAQMRYLIAPTTGANNAVFTPSGSVNIRGIAINYTGCKQSGQPDATAQGNGASSQNVNVVASNCWMVSVTIGFNNDFDTPGSGYVTPAGVLTTLRQYYDDGIALADSNGTVGTGNQAYYWNSLNGNNGRIAASIAPATNTEYTQAVTATAALSSTLIKGMSKTLTVTPAVSATVRKQMAKALNATVAITASMVKQMAKALTANVVVTGLLTATKVTLKTLEATVAVTASIAKIPGKILSGTAAVTATIAKTSTLARTLQATAAITASVTKGLSKALTASAAITSTLTKIPNKLLAVTTAITATLDKTQAKVLSATAAVTATMVAGRAVIMTATVATTATVGKTVGKLLAVTLSITAKVLAPFWRTKYPTHGDEDDYQIKYPHD